MSAVGKAARARAALRGKLAFHTTGMILSLLFLAPLAWSILVSFKTPGEARQPPLPPWPVGGISFDSYGVLSNFGIGIWSYAGNSLTVALSTAVLSVIVGTLGGYGFARYDIPGKSVLFVLLLSTIMIPFQSILTPLFLIMTKLGLQNSLTGLTLIYVTLQMPFSVFVMRNAFEAVPREMEEAARMDGARTVMILVRIMLPLTIPGIVTVAIFAFLAAWNEFLAALVFLTDQDKYTMPILIATVTNGRFGSINWGPVQAGVALMMLPCLVIFLTLQRFYLRGLTAGAVK